MKKVMSLMLVFSVVFMGFASTLAQSPNLEAQTFASTIQVDEPTFAFEAELSDAELSEVDGEGPWTALTAYGLIRTGISSIGADKGVVSNTLGVTEVAVGAVLGVAAVALPTP